MGLSDTEKAERILKGYCPECFEQEHTYTCSQYDPIQSMMDQLHKALENDRSSDPAIAGMMEELDRIREIRQ